MTHPTYTPAKKTRGSLLLAALVTASFALPAAAATLSPVETVIDGKRVDVLIDPAHFETLDGKRAVYKQLKTEAAAACTYKSGFSQSVDRMCANDLMDDFVTSLGDADITSFHNGV